MSDEKFREVVARKKQEMTRERYEQIGAALLELRLGEAEMLAWHEIEKELTKWGGDHKFAEKAVS